MKAEKLVICPPGWGPDRKRRADTAAAKANTARLMKRRAKKVAARAGRPRKSAAQRTADWAEVQAMRDCIGDLSWKTGDHIPERHFGW